MFSVLIYSASNFVHNLHTAYAYLIRFIIRKNKIKTKARLDYNNELTESCTHIDTHTHNHTQKSTKIDETMLTPNKKCASDSIELNNSINQLSYIGYIGECPNSPIIYATQCLLRLYSVDWVCFFFVCFIGPLIGYLYTTLNVSLSNTHDTNDMFRYIFMITPLKYNPTNEKVKTCAWTMKIT